MQHPAIPTAGLVCKPGIGLCHEPAIRAVQLRPFLGLRKLRSLDAVRLNPPGCLKACHLCKRSCPHSQYVAADQSMPCVVINQLVMRDLRASPVRQDMQASILRTVCSASSNDGRQATGCVIRHLNRMSLSHAQSLTPRAQCVDQPAARTLWSVRSIQHKQPLTNSAGQAKGNLTPRYWAVF